MICRFLAFLQRICGCHRAKTTLAKTGSVKFYDRKKKFGFITPDDGTADAFVHIIDVAAKALYENQRVSFKTEMTARGLTAIDVRQIPKNQL